MLSRRPQAAGRMPVYRDKQQNELVTSKPAQSCPNQDVIPPPPLRRPQTPLPSIRKIFPQHFTNSPATCESHHPCQVIFDHNAPHVQRHPQDQGYPRDFDRRSMLHKRCASNSDFIHHKRKKEHEYITYPGSMDFPLANQHYDQRYNSALHQNVYSINLYERRENDGNRVTEDHPSTSYYQPRVIPRFSVEAQKNGPVINRQDIHENTQETYQFNFSLKKREKRENRENREAQEALELRFSIKR